MVLQLDVTGSMLFDYNGRQRLELLNIIVRRLCTTLFLDARARAAVEVAFVVFTDQLLLVTDFMQLDKIDARQFQSADPTYRNHIRIQQGEIKNSTGRTLTVRVPQFQVSDTDNGTKIGMATLKSMELLQKRVIQRKNSPSGCHTPFLITITDGHPDSQRGVEYQDEDQHRAVERIKAHCFGNGEHLIIPIVIGVGDEKEIGTQTLKDYSGGFVDGFFHVRDDVSAELIQILSDTICNVIKLSITADANTIRDKVQDGYAEYQSLLKNQ